MALNEARASFVPLFLVSLATVGYETALTRFFAVSKWSEYGYWVISIVMVGFALSGVLLALFRDAFVRRARWLLRFLPGGLIAAAAVGYYLATINPFNPLQLQNHATWLPQIWNICAYYAALLPFFFASGLFIGITFLLHGSEIGRVYGYDLTGAGTGALLVLALMFVVDPFRLVPVLLLPLAAAACVGNSVGRRPAILVAAAALLAGEVLLFFGQQPAISEFKPIYAPLHTPDAKVVAEVRSPHGAYSLLDDFTERVDTDISNNAEMLGLPGPPTAFGLYRDGNRIASLPRPGRIDTGYARATLDSLPYELIPHARVLLAGASGGFRLAEVRALGAGDVSVLEPEPVLRRALRHGFGPSPAPNVSASFALSGESPVAAASHSGGYDIVDLSTGFLDQTEANAHAFATEAIARLFASLRPGGMLSIPVSIRDFPVYAVRMLATVRAALLKAGVADPPSHVLVYRSAWNVRILVSAPAWDAERIAAVRKFCDDRSFDVSYYPGIDVAAARPHIYNDLPSVSFEQGEVASSGPDDAIADEAQAVLKGEPTASEAAFDLRPITFDRPFFYAVLRLSRLDTIWQRLEVLPQQEVSAIVNVAVLAQAVVIAVAVLLVPLAAPRRTRLERHGLLRPILYFPALGLGFLFIEIFLIEKASFYLNDRTSAFALVLTGMLIASGCGAMTAHRFDAEPRRGIALAAGVILIWCALVWGGLEPAMLATLQWPWLLRALLLLLLLTPVAVALGLPFPIGLSRAGDDGFLPWAWGLNGAFSVVATPLANLTAREVGYNAVLLAAALVYAIAYLTLPAIRKSHQWNDISAHSRVGG